MYYQNSNSSFPTSWYISGHFETPFFISAGQTGTKTDAHCYFTLVDSFYSQHAVCIFNVLNKTAGVPW